MFKLNCTNILLMIHLVFPFWGMETWNANHPMRIGWINSRLKALTGKSVICTLYLFGVLNFQPTCWCKWSVSCISPILCWCKPHEIYIALYTDDYIKMHKYRSCPSYPTWTYLYAFPFWCMLQPSFQSAQSVAKRGLGSLFAIATFHGHLGCQMQRVIDMTHQKWGDQWRDGGFHKWGYPKMDGYLGKSY